MVTGTFDGLHQGHFDLFRQAREHGKKLVVVVARDKTVLAVKGRIPRKKEQERLLAVQQCELVHEAVLGNQEDPYRVIGRIKPDVICLGYDQKAFTETLKERLREMGLKTVIMRAKSYYPEKYHSSLLN